MVVTSSKMFVETLLRGKQQSEQNNSRTKSVIGWEWMKREKKKCRFVVEHLERLLSFLTKQ